MRRRQLSGTMPVPLSESDWQLPEARIPRVRPRANRPAPCRLHDRRSMQPLAIRIAVLIVPLTAASPMRRPSLETPLAHPSSALPFTRNKVSALEIFRPQSAANAARQVAGV